MQIWEILRIFSLIFAHFRGKMLNFAVSLGKKANIMPNTAKNSSIEAIRFTKMHGLGNDYIYIDCMETGSEPERLPDLAREMSDRHFGIGGDGIVLILPPTDTGNHARMRMFNADGSEGRMCGNASRCIAAYLNSHHLPDLNIINLETAAGVKVLSLIKDPDGRLSAVTVDMGEPVFSYWRIPVDFEKPVMLNEPVEVCGQTVYLSAVSMGNPHGVVFVDSLDDTDIATLGPTLECHPMWPERANIEFVEVVSPTHLKMRVWERGSGETLACGTGACAAFAVANIVKRTANRLTVSLLGGDLDICITEDGHILMTGPATEVFTGVYHRKS